MKNKASGQIRIIAGRWRRRIIPVCDIPELRPTADRIRETVFNWLQPYLPGAHCIDAFAGSGALGLEALSRGAESVSFIEQHRAAARHLQKQLGLLGADTASVQQQDALSALAQHQRNIDILFLDPPFAKPELVSQSIGAARAQLNTQALIYVEQAKQHNYSGEHDMHLLKHKTSGNVCYQLWQIGESPTL